MRRIKTRIAEFCKLAAVAVVAAGLLVQPFSINPASAAEAGAKKPQNKSGQSAKAPAKTASSSTAKPAAASKAKPKPAAAAPKKKAARPERALLRPGDGFHHDGRFVRVEAFHAQGEGQLPAVIILHGASGLGDGTLFYPQAKALAERGISAFVVHYFDGLPSRRNAASPGLHDKRELIVTEALNYLESQPYVDRDRIGVFGLSLGGFQALSLASKDERIQAVVDVIGAMPAQVAREGVARMPPTMILHGDRDRTVPFRRAQELAQMLDSLGTPYEMKIYHGETHNFRVAAREDSIREAADFFVRHLKARL
jgi:dipeptidyl aminopeptidase/acylaminoacyl peptidase